MANFFRAVLIVAIAITFLSAGSNSQVPAPYPPPFDLNTCDIATLCDPGNHDCDLACINFFDGTYSCSCFGAGTDCDAVNLLPSQRGPCDGYDTLKGGCGCSSACSGDPVINVIPVACVKPPTEPIRADFCNEPRSVNETYGNDCNTTVSTCGTDYYSGFWCTCHPGYVQIPGTNGTTNNYTSQGCAPDECASGVHDCDLSTEVCTDIAQLPSVKDVGWNCTCKDGFNRTAGAGSACVNVNECDPGMPVEWEDNCHINATCTDKSPGFQCTCPASMTGDGVSCVDIDECAIGSHSCSHHAADCFNESPGYRCECRAPYVVNTSPGMSGDATGSEGCYLPAGVNCTELSCWTHPFDNATVANCSLSTVPGSDNSTLACACPVGFTGTGFDVVGGCKNSTVCDGNACEPDLAVCVPNDDGVTYRCDCTVDSVGNGFTFDSGGTGCPTQNSTCAANSDCWVNATNPDVNATCTDHTSADGTVTYFKCTCPVEHNGVLLNLTGSGHGSTGCIYDPCMGADCAVTENECALGHDDCWDEKDLAVSLAEIELKESKMRLQYLIQTSASALQISVAEDEVLEKSFALNSTLNATHYLNVTCIDLPNSFDCGPCPAGYVGDGHGPYGCQNTTLLGPCLDGTHECDALAVCLTGPTCVCPWDTYGDARKHSLGGTACPRVADECAEAAANGTDICWTWPSDPASVKATCTDQLAGWSCTCPSGWTGDGRRAIDPPLGASGCVDVDECAPAVTPCTASGRDCTNTNGSYVCSCPAGLVFDPAFLPSGRCKPPPGTISFTAISATSVAVGTPVIVTVTAKVGEPRLLRINFTSPTPSKVTFDPPFVSFNGSGTVDVKVSSVAIGVPVISTPTDMDPPGGFSFPPAFPSMEFLKIPDGAGFNCSRTTFPATRRRERVWTTEVREITCSYFPVGDSPPIPVALSVANADDTETPSTLVDPSKITVSARELLFGPGIPSLAFTVTFGPGSGEGSFALNITSSDPRQFRSPSEVIRWSLTKQETITVTMLPPPIPARTGPNYNIDVRVSALPRVRADGNLSITATSSDPSAVAVVPDKSTVVFDVDTGTTALAWVVDPLKVGTYKLALSVDKDPLGASFMYDITQVDGQAITVVVIDPSPTVFAVNPTTSPIAGGILVTVTGIAFAAKGVVITGVQLAGTQCSLVSIADESIVCTAGAAASPKSGRVDVYTTTDQAFSPAGSRADTVTPEPTFTYAVTPPAVTAVVPDEGSARGGTLVFVHGFAFGSSSNAGSQVVFADSPCVDSLWLSENLIVCRGTPAGPVGEAVDIRVDLVDPKNSSSVVMGTPPLVRGFTYGLGCVCYKEEGARQICRDIVPPERCDCEHGWSGEACTKTSFSVSFASQDLLPTLVEESSPTLMNIDLEVSVGTNPTTPPVDVTCNAAIPAQMTLNPSRLTFATVSKQMVTVSVTNDGVRDGDIRVGVQCTGSAPGDPVYHGAIGFAEVRVEDAKIAVLKVEPSLSALEGSEKPFTLTGVHFDPEVDVLVDGKPALNVTIVRRSRKQSGVGKRDAAGFVDRTDDIVAVTFFTPPHDAEGSYADVVAVNSFGGNGTVEKGVFYTDNCPDPGMYGFGNECKPCPVGAYCPGGYRVRPLEGYWNPGEDSGYVVECKPRHRCKGWGEDEQRSLCHPGYTGDACAKCEDGWVVEIGGRCVPCPDSGVQISLILADALLWVLISLAMWVIEDRENVAHITAVVMALQTIAGTGKLLSSQLPGWMLEVYSVFRLFTSELSFLKLECTGKVPFVQNFFVQIAYFAGIWVIMAGGTWVAGKISVRVNKKHGEVYVDNRRRHYEYRLRRTHMMVPWLVYLTLLTSSLQATVCVPFPDPVNPQGTVLRLRADMEVECFKGAHIAVFAVGLLGLFASVAFPVGISYFLHRVGDDALTDVRLVNSYDVAHEAFRAEMRHAFYIEIGVSVALALGDTVLSDNILGQMICLSMAFGTVLIFISAARPFHRNWENVATFFLMLAHLLTVIVIYVVSSQEVADIALEEGAGTPVAASDGDPTQPPAQPIYILIIIYVVAALLVIVMITFVSVAIYNIGWKVVPDEIKRSYDDHAKGVDIPEELALSDPVMAWRRERARLETAEEKASFDQAAVAELLRRSGGSVSGAAGSGLLPNQVGVGAALFGGTSTVDPELLEEGVGPSLINTITDKVGKADLESDQTAEAGILELFTDLFGGLFGIVDEGADAGDDVAALPPPAYWSNEKPAMGQAAVLVDVTDSLLEVMQDIINSTWKAELVGKGYDVRTKGHSHRAARVVKVFRIENRSLWGTYALKIAAIRKRLSDRSEQILPMAMETDGIDVKLSAEIEPLAGEALLFHGTGPAGVECISATGIDERLSRDGLFGKGIYVAESSSKADEYASPREEDGLCAMFVMRCAMGTSYVTDRPLKGIQRPPCHEGHVIPCVHPRYDSVIAQNGTGRLESLKYREFILYDRSQGYPEFLIEYVREQ